MFKKVLIGTIVAAALFAVGAFAASFADVNAEDVASGNDTVDECAAEVDIDFTTVYDNAGDWDVSAAKLTFYDSAGATTTGCAGFGANLAVMTTSGTPAATGTATVPAASSTVTVNLSSTLKASAITEAAVLVDGKNLQVATPGQGFVTTTTAP